MEKLYRVYANLTFCDWIEAESEEEAEEKFLDVFVNLPGELTSSDFDIEEYGK